MGYNWRQVKAIESANKKKFLKQNETLNDNSGIYFLTRIDENGIKYAYVGQAKHILTRLAQHMVGYQHIDLSLKSHGLYNEDNIYGWKVEALNFEQDLLDQKEQEYIIEYANKGYQLRNKKNGGQNGGSSQIDEYRPKKGYRDGLEQGYKNASKEIANLFEKHLNYSQKSDKSNKNQEKAIQKLEEFLTYYKDKKE